MGSPLVAPAVKAGDVLLLDIETDAEVFVSTLDIAGHIDESGGVRVEHAGKPLRPKQNRAQGQRFERVSETECVRVARDETESTRGLGGGLAVGTCVRGRVMTREGVVVRGPRIEGHCILLGHQASPGLVERVRIEGLSHRITRTRTEVSLIQDRTNMNVVRGLDYARPLRLEIPVARIVGRLQAPPQAHVQRHQLTKPAVSSDAPRYLASAPLTTARAAGMPASRATFPASRSV